MTDVNETNVDERISDFSGAGESEQNSEDIVGKGLEIMEYLQTQTEAALNDYWEKHYEVVELESSIEDEVSRQEREKMKLLVSEIKAYMDHLKDPHPNVETRKVIDRTFIWCMKEYVEDLRDL